MDNDLPGKCNNCFYLYDENYGSTKPVKCMCCLNSQLFSEYQSLLTAIAMQYTYAMMMMCTAATMFQTMLLPHTFESVPKDTVDNNKTDKATDQ